MRTRAGLGGMPGGEFINGGAGGTIDMVNGMGGGAGGYGRRRR